MAFDLLLRENAASGAKSTYLGIFKDTNPRKESLVGISSNKPSVATSSVYKSFYFTTPIALEGGVKYYLFFLENKDSYTTVTNRIGLTSQSANIWADGISWSSITHTDYAPLFKAVISDVALPVIYHSNKAGTFYREYTSKVETTTSKWSDLWLSSESKPQVAITASDLWMEASSCYFGATTSEKTFTIQALGQYKVKGFQLTALAETTSNTDCNVTITKPDATTATYKQSDGTTLMADVSLATSATSTTFKVKSDNGNGRLKNVELVVLLETDNNKITTYSDLGVYNIKLKAGDYYITSSSKITTTSGSSANIQFISTGTSDQYYLYSVDDHKFFKDASPDTRTDSPALSLVPSKEEATPFNIKKQFNIPYQYIIEPNNSTDNSCLIAYAKANDRNVANYSRYLDQYSWHFLDVSYDSKTLIQTYMTEKSVGAILSVANQLGFPKTTSASYILLKNLTDSINNTSLADTWRYNADIYTRLQSYYNAYIAETDIVMPEDGKVYRFTNVQKDLTTKFYVYHNLTNNELGLSSSILNNGTDLFVCHVIDASKNQFAFVSTNGYYMVGATGSNGKGMNDTYDSDKQHCTIARHPADNNSTSPSAEKSFGKISMFFKRRVEVTSATYLVVKNDGTWDGNSGSYVNDTYSSMFTIEERSDYYNKVNLTSNGTDAYASLYLPFSVEIPSGITAYKVTSQNGEYAHMESIVTNGILPKETAAILKKDGQTSNTTVYLSPATGAGEAVAGNLLGGTVAAAEEKPGSGTTYVLGKIDGVIGLYEYTPTNLAPGKAYLNVAAGVKALAFDFGDTDGIKTMDNGQLKMDNSNIFNLAGQRMNKLQRGVNIVNGKKIIVK